MTVHNPIAQATSGKDRHCSGTQSKRKARQFKREAEGRVRKAINTEDSRLRHGSFLSRRPQTRSQIPFRAIPTVCSCPLYGPSSRSSSPACLSVSSRSFRERKKPSSLCSRSSRGATSRTSPRSLARRSMPRTPMGRKPRWRATARPAVSSIRIASASSSSARMIASAQIPRWSKVARSCAKSSTVGR